MTANEKRWEGAAGATGTVVPVGNLAVATTAGAGTIVYSTAAGFTRGDENGVEIYAGTTGTDLAYIGFSTTTADTAEAYTYVRFTAWPTAGSLTGVHPWMAIRGSGGNLLRVTVNPSGVFGLQTASGGNLAAAGQTFQASLNTTYRVEANVDPGTTTSDGTGALRVYDDDGGLIFDSGTIAGQNFGTSATTGTPTTFWVGDFTGTANGPFACRMLVNHLAMDTAAGSAPNIPGVTKNTVNPTPSSSGLYPRVLWNGVWQGAPA